MNDPRKSTITETDDDGAEKEKTPHGLPVKVLEEPVEPDEEAASPSTGKTHDESSKGHSTEPTMVVKGSSASEVEERITEPFPHDDERAGAETVLKAIRGYMFGRKRALTAAEKA